MDGSVAQPPGRVEVGAAGAGRQIYDKALRPQPGQYCLAEHRRRHRVHHCIKSRRYLPEPVDGDAPQPEALGQRRQPDAQRLPHRPEAGQQNAAAPEGAAALFHQDADAPFRRGDGVADGQLFPGEVVYQLYPGLGGDGFRLHRQHPAQRQRTGPCGPQQFGQRRPCRVQRQGQQDIICQCNLFGSAHRITCPFQHPACRRLPGIGAHHHKQLFRFHAASPFACSWAILCGRNICCEKTPPAFAGGVFYHDYRMRRPDIRHIFYFTNFATARATMPPRMPETRNSATPCTPTSSTTNMKGFAAPLTDTRFCT